MSSNKTNIYKFTDITHIKNDNKKAKEIIKIVVDLLNAGFVIHGNFCKNILNNCCNNIIDICCTIHQYVYFGNMSL